MLDTFMRQLMQDLEMKESFSTEVPGVYAFPVDEETTVLISNIARGFELTCTVGEGPKGREEEFYTQALFANLYERGSEGCVVGLDAEGKHLTLSRVIEYTIDYKEFTGVLEDFLNAVDFWKQETATYTP